MSPEAQRIAIAQVSGWKNVCLDRVLWKHRYDKFLVGDSPNNTVSRSLVPDYLNDLNAMHEVEKTLTASQWDKYRKTLAREWMTNDDDGMWAAINTTAAQRAEAFLRTLNLWNP